MAILGLLIDEPDDVRGLERRLAEVFPLARFMPTSANSAVARLRDQGHVCEEESKRLWPLGRGRAHYARVLRALRDGTARSGIEAAYSLSEAGELGAGSRSLFRATPGGVTVFGLWMSAASPIPAVREDLRGKFVFARPEHVPSIMQGLELQIQECREEYETVHASLRAIEDYQAELDESLDEQEWSALMMIPTIRDDAAYWTTRIDRLEKLRAYLEEIRGEAIRRSLPAHLREA